MINAPFFEIMEKMKVIEESHQDKTTTRVEYEIINQMNRP